MADLLTQMNQTALQAPALEQQRLATTTPQAQTDIMGGLAARTGVAASPSGGAGGPRASTIGTQVATSQARQALAGLGTQAAIQGQQQGQQQADQQSAVQQEMANVALNRRAVSQSAAQQEKDIIDSARREGQKLTWDKDQARLEQLGFTLGLQDDKYINKLQDAGTRTRLDTAAGFKEQLQQDIYGDLTKIQTQDINFQQMIDADDRTFNESLANINIDAALQMASLESRAAGQAATISGVAGTAKAGEQAYTTYADYQDKHPPQSGDENFVGPPTSAMGG